MIGQLLACLSKGLAMDNPDEIEMEVLRNWLESGKQVEVIDVRPESDFKEWHIPGSANIDVYQAIHANSPGALANYRSSPNKTVVVVCYTGRTSLVAAQYLRSRGIPATSLSGGMRRWSLAWNFADLHLQNCSARVVQIRRTGKGCLSYLVGSGQEALVIDPSIDSQVYRELALKNGWRITWILDTHIHADHISRAIELAKLTGAIYSLPIQDRVAFDYKSINDGDIIGVGDTHLTAFSTPGHTKESMTFRLGDIALFTGDTIFLDSIGRPDLKASPEETQYRSHLLYHTLQKFRTFDPTMLVLPGHTNRPVAFDGIPISATLGEVINRNTVLDCSEDSFKQWIMERLPANPPNYEQIVALNEQGQFPNSNLVRLEAGANRCAITSG